jgi:hypothetical protein
MAQLVQWVQKDLLDHQGRQEAKEVWVLKEVKELLEALEIKVVCFQMKSLLNLERVVF